MTKTPFSISFLFVMAAALPLTAQTTPPASAPAHHTATTTAGHRTAGGCVTPPTLSPKIPALPASAPCVKALYTVTKASDTKLDYASPLVSPEVREALGGGPETYSLEYVDTQAGTGGAVKAGKWLSVHYTGYLAEDGKKFDSSHDHPGGGQPISFPYGSHQVIPGWDTGFEGMHIGGKRRLIIPYQLAYGPTAHGPIPAKAELVFDVEVVSQSDTRPTPPPGAKSSAPPTGRPGTPSSTPPAGMKTLPPGSTPPPGMTTAPSGTTPPPGSTTPPGGATTPPPGSGAPPSASSSAPPPGGTTPAKPQ